MKKDLGSRPKGKALCGLLLFLCVGSADAQTAIGTNKPIRIELKGAMRRHGVLTVKAEGSETHPGACPEVPATKDSYVLDPEKGTKYMILTDEKGDVLGSKGGYACGAFGVWAKFPAPPPEVKSIDIVLTGFQSFENVRLNDE